VTRRLKVTAVLAVLALGGCATAAGPTLSVAVAEPPPEERAAQARQDCHRSAAGAAGSRVLAAAFESAGLASVYLVLRGAADGAWLGFLAGGGSGAKDGAWIGAAAGAGLGILIGTGVGIKEGVEAYGRYRSAFDACVAQRLAPSSDDHPAGSEGQVTTLLPVDADW